MLLIYQTKNIFLICDPKLIENTFNCLLCPKIYTYIIHIIFYDIVIIHLLIICTYPKFWSIYIPLHSPKGTSLLCVIQGILIFHSIHCDDSSTSMRQCNMQSHANAYWNSVVNFAIYLHKLDRDFTTVLPHVILG